jgi:hypothetical protein
MLMYTLVPAEMLGLVSSVDWFVSIGLTPLSFALTGPIERHSEPGRTWRARGYSDC